MNATIRVFAYTLLAALALAISVFPAAESEGQLQRDPFMQAIERADVRYAAQSEMLRRAHSRELARAAVARTAHNPMAFAVDRPSDVPPLFAERIASVYKALLHVSPHDTSVRVVVTLAVDTGDVIDGTPVRRAYGSVSFDVFPPGSAADRVCVVVARALRREWLIPSTQRQLNYWVADDGRGGPCGWYAKYGVPGRGVTRWLDSTGYAALSADPRDGFRTRYEARPSRLGLRTDVFTDATFGACFAGRTAACDALVLGTRYDNYWGDIDVTLKTRGWTGTGRRPPGPGNAIAATMLLRLEAELGPAGFTNFWKSDDAVPAAFAGARGEESGDWVGQSIRVGAAGYHAGPLPTLGVWATMLVLVPVMLAIGVRAVAKRGQFA